MSVFSCLKMFKWKMLILRVTLITEFLSFLFLGLITSKNIFYLTDLIYHFYYFTQLTSFIIFIIRDFVPSSLWLCSMRKIPRIGKNKKLWVAHKFPVSNKWADCWRISRKINRKLSSFSVRNESWSILFCGQFFNLLYSIHNRTSRINLKN